MITVKLSSEPLVSVVTPVYNGARYLSECIESVLAQSYQNWDYTIVNNCSTDATLEIAESYARRDSRIRIHNNSTFLDLVQNGNQAVRQISPDSKYCKVVHADDCLFPECLTRMVAVAEENPSVAIVSAYALYGTRVELDGLPYPSTLVPGREVCRLMLTGRLRSFGSPTSTLIRSDRVRERDSFYDETELHVDRAVCYEILQNSDFGFVHQVLTYSRQHDESITNTVVSRMYTSALTDVSMLKKYGRIYLGDKEYEKCLRETHARYYRILARSVFQRKGKEFWRYHRSKLEQIGEPLRGGRLAKALGAYILERLLTPRETIRSTLRKLRNGRASSVHAPR